MVLLWPPSTYVISAVTPLARLLSKKAATLPTSSMVTLRRVGETWQHPCCKAHTLFTN